jgi:type IV pilus assembly protein PilM
MTSRASWLAAPPPAVAIDVTSRRITVLGISATGRGSAVRGFAAEPLPPGAVVPALTGQNIVARDVVVTALTKALQRAGLASTRRAALLVPDSVARVSLLPLASVPTRPADLDQVLRWQLRKSAPFPIEQAQVSYSPASRTVEATTFAGVIARRDVITQYEEVAAAAGIHAGVVDLASFNVMNAIMAGEEPAGDALLVHVTPEGTTLAILRSSEVLFYRHRTSVEDEPLGALVHQTAMYHEDRLGGGRFARVWLSGTGSTPDVRRAIADRLGADVHTVDVRRLLAFEEGALTGDLLDAIAAPVGVLLRDRKAA